jgi:hypothetical protein
VPAPRRRYAPADAARSTPRRRDLLTFVPALVTLEAIEIRRELRLLEQGTLRDLVLLARVVDSPPAPRTERLPGPRQVSLAPLID